MGPGHPPPQDTAPSSSSYFNVATTVKEPQLSSMNLTVLSVRFDLSNKRVTGVCGKGKRNKRADGESEQVREERKEQRKGK